MTRLPLASNGRSTRRIGALHTGDDTRLVIIETGERPRVVEAKSLPKGTGRQGDFLRDLRLDEVVHVVPAAQIVCRLVDATLTGDHAQDAPAIDLLAETQLPESIPPHRRAGGVISESQVLLTAWPERDGPIDAPAQHRWIAEPAALAIVCDGGLAWHADRTTGSISIVARHAGATRVRATLGDASGDEAWHESVAAPLAEMARAVGLDAPDDVTAPFHLPEGAVAALTARVAGVTNRDAWIQRYAIALGAALGVAAEPSTASLATLRATEPRRKAPAHHRIATWISKPKNALATIVACVVLALVSPLALASARLALLESKTSSLAQREEELQILRGRAALYRQLGSSRWPMTKLLGDISGATPVGITADSIRLNSRQGLYLDGRADSDDLIVNFQQQLADTRIFYNVKIDSTDSSLPGGVGFSLSADIRNPLSDVTPAEDFGDLTLAERLYGDGADNTEFSAQTRTNTTRTTRRPSTTRDSVDRERDEAPSRAGARPTSQDDEPVPPPLTDDEIKAMDRMQALRESVTRRTYPQKNASLDDATKARLQKDVERLQDHARSLQGGG